MDIHPLGTHSSNMCCVYVNVRINTELLGSKRLTNAGLFCANTPTNTGLFCTKKPTKTKLFGTTSTNTVPIDTRLFCTEKPTNTVLLCSKSQEPVFVGALLHTETCKHSALSRVCPKSHSRRGCAQTLAPEVPQREPTNAGLVCPTSLDNATVGHGKKGRR